MRRKPDSGDPPEGAHEAMVKELNARGMAYSFHGKEFPPNEWVSVTAKEAAQLLWLEAFTVRPKEEA